jgi:hypothetical protein
VPEQKPYPHVSQGLLDYLEDKFPDRCPKPSEDDRAIWMAVGAREVVAHLQFCHNQCAESSAEVHVTRV